jgi:hypothetical protein
VKRSGLGGRTHGFAPTGRGRQVPLESSAVICVMGEHELNSCLQRASPIRIISVYLRLQFTGETFRAARRHSKEMEIGTPDSARFCAGVQLNAPTYRTDDACRQAITKRVFELIGVFSF